MDTAAEQPQLTFVSAAGLRLAVWDWPGDGPPIVFVHAAGYHGRVWDRIARQFPGRRRFALELRGHGRSDKPAPPYTWPAFGTDTAAALAEIGVRGAIGAGHSLGGYSLVSAAQLRPEAFAALLLIDPVVFPPFYYGAPPLDASFILKRRTRWVSPAEIFERFRARAPFSEWDPAVLRDYCAFALLARDGAFDLACLPEAEASIYTEANRSEANPCAGLSRIEVPVTVLRSGTVGTPGIFDLTASPTWPDLAAQFPRGRDCQLAHANHYLPMQFPDLIAAEIRALL